MYPSTITSFQYPSTTSRLNNPSHSNLHNTTSSAIAQMQEFIGQLDGVNASLVGTLLYDIRSANSDGGGHVQSASKGGTGQTTYTKGDLFVAINTSTISKLAVGADGQALVADSSVAAGVKWGIAPGSKVFASVLSSIVGNGTVQEQSVFSVTIPSSTLGTNNAVVVNLRGVVSAGDAAASVLVRAIYGGARVASILMFAGANNTVDLGGGLECRVFGNGSANAQHVELWGNFQKRVSSPPSSSVMTAYDFGTASVASGNPQTLGLTWRFSTDSTANNFVPKGLVVEKIT